MTTMILLPAYASSGIELPPGSRVIEAGCGHLSWISPSGTDALMTKPGWKTACGRCVDMSEASGFLLPHATEVELIETLGAETAFRVADLVRHADEEIRARRQKRQ